jgi:hypothetical protein
MSQPTANSVQVVDPVLTNMLLAYMQADDRFVADRVAPAIPVDTITSTYYALTQSYWFADEAQQRAPGGSVARGGYGITSATVETIQYALGHIIPREVRANNQVPMSLERVAAQWLSQQHLINRERRFSAAAMVTGVWGTSNTSATDWDDFANSDPASDVLTGKRTISQATGMAPNQMVMGEIVMDALNNHPDLIDRIKYTQAATATSIRAALAAIFEMEILVGKAIYNSAQEGQTASYAAIIDDDCLLVHTTPGADMMTASGVKTFMWQPGGGLGSIEPIWFDNAAKSDVLDSMQQNAHKITASNLGYIFLDIV